ncbi:MAG: ABC transporter ATP-binding protein [Halobacteriales archaeon]
MAELELDGVRKRYDDAQGTEVAVEEVSLTVADGEFLTLVGPSGCGKSTTIRMVAGLESVTDGDIRIDGESIVGRPPSRRAIAMVFQNYGLYRHMSVRENMGYGLKHSAGLSREERRSKVQEIAEILEIEDQLEKSVLDLSGGQKQRVALGRAIVRDPDVFLLDEPLANLDAKLRTQMRTELSRIQQNLDITTIYVTHDQTEAMTLSDRLAVMRDGRIQQVADPEVAYEEPTNEFVGTFLGSPAMNVFDAVARPNGNRTALSVGDVTMAGIRSERLEFSVDTPVRVGIRPEDMTLHDDHEAGDLYADVRLTEFQGNDNFVHLDIADDDWTARVPPDVIPESGDRIGVTVAPEDIHVFDRESGENLVRS